LLCSLRQSPYEPARTFKRRSPVSSDTVSGCVRLDRLVALN
jgi:hypothetical protein